MCDQTCLDFGARNLPAVEVKGKHIIEVGAADVNGSLKNHIMTLQPASYLGVDINPGPNVDQIIDATDLASTFGRESFDLLICTEVLEHIHNWKAAVSNFKQILKPGGILVLSTRSIGFGKHNFPDDYWRFEDSDIAFIFSDFYTNVIEKDSLAPGVFIKTTKPINFMELDLSEYPVYSIRERTRI